MYDNTTFILLVMNCQKYRSKALRQKELWLNKLTCIPYYHVLADPELVTNEKEYLFDEREHILWVKTQDDYNSLPNKVIASYHACVSEFAKLKYVFKTDDDQICKINDPNKFFTTLTSSLSSTNVIPEKYHYGGDIVDVPTPYLSQYHQIHPELPTHLPVMNTKYCSGRFYILSKEAIHDLLKKRHYIEEEYLEDYAIGYHLSAKYKQYIKKILSNMFFEDIEEN